MKTNNLFFSILKHVILIIFALCFIIPIWLMFVSAFRQTTSILSYPPMFWPTDGNFDNFKQIFSMQDGILFRWFFNSVIIAGGNTILVIIVCLGASYAFAKREFVGKRVLFPLIIATQMIPAVATLIPQYLIVSKAGWINDYLGLIAPSVASAFGVFLITQFMKEIPTEIIEAARIDGANDYGIFGRIIVPAALPAISLLAIFNFTQQWGSLTWPLIVVTESSMRTMPLGIASMKDLSSNVSGPIMAASFISFLPVLIAFLFARDKFMAGIMVGAVKG